MLGGQNSDHDLKDGDLVYIYQPIDWILTSYDISAQPFNGHGVVVDAMLDSSLPRYLRSARLISVLINGKIGLYAPHEIFRIKPRNVSKNSRRSRDRN